MKRRTMMAMGMGAVLGVSGPACARPDPPKPRATAPAAQRTPAMTTAPTTPPAEKTPPSTKETTDAKLAVLELSGPAAASRTAVTVQLLLRNDGEAQLWANQRLVVNAEHAPAEARDVWLEVVDASGRKLAFQEKVRAGAADAKHYRALAKGQSKQIAIDLSRYFDFDKPGTYEVTAYYHDGNPKPPAGPKGSTHLALTLRSAPLKLQLQ